MMLGLKDLILCLLQLVLFLPGLRASWDEWWTYDGISGPEFWGLINPNWNMCERGRRQSPINIEPDKLVYDPHLRHIHIDKHKISGTLHNTGQSVIFKVEKGTKHHVNITGGPLVYKYRFEDLYIHFGEANDQGSEHQINGAPFHRGCIQLYGYNADLYRNMSEARLGSNGIVGLSIMIQVGENGNDDVGILASGFQKVIYRGQKWPIKHLSLAGLLPTTHHYMTYDGSTTHPGCWETTTWLIMNKPVYITKQQLYALRLLMQGDQATPKAKMANNFRPAKPLHHRTVRTNIDFTNAHRSKGCPTMHREMFYAARQWPKL
ncbi:carbonic anhydrase-related protein 10-like [Homarus americanus]|uniref:carbonic anhydrase-related protein 10-like n=1 Tax=Homarus americanus TaxID=6706 RepID=UPI001C46E1EA|nr:carbonic anhydrase-related protein 10-like [Homarus americanus]